MSHFLGTALKELQDIVFKEREFGSSCDIVELHFLIIQASDFKQLWRGDDDFFQ